MWTLARRHFPPFSGLNIPLLCSQHLYCINVRPHAICHFLLAAGWSRCVHCTSSVISKALGRVSPSLGEKRAGQHERRRARVCPLLFFSLTVTHYSATWQNNNIAVIITKMTPKFSPTDSISEVVKKKRKTLSGNCRQNRDNILRYYLPGVGPQASLCPVPPGTLFHEMMAELVVTAATFSVWTALLSTVTGDKGHFSSAFHTPDHSYMYFLQSTLVTCLDFGAGDGPLDVSKDGVDGHGVLGARAEALDHVEVEVVPKVDVLNVII